MAGAGLCGQSLFRVLGGLAEDFLVDAQGAAQRLAAGDNAEALHDLRVALRRLHSLLRIYRRDVRAVLPAGKLKAVRRLARATNSARDAEVQRLWLQAHGKGLRRAERAGYAWLLARLTPQAQPLDPQRLARDLERLVRRLRKPLARLAAGGGGEFCRAVAAHAAPLTADLVDQLRAVTGPDDVRAAHAARISVKRLRYLLSPLRPECPACTAVVMSLSELQDVLGELHDRHLLREQLPDLAAAAAAEAGREAFAVQMRAAVAAAWGPPQWAGLLAAARRNQAQIEHLYETLQRRYLNQLAELHTHLLQVVAALQNGPSGTNRVS